MPRIFISYRRDDSQITTSRLADHLKAHFGADNVFYDMESIPKGSDFSKFIKSYIEKSDVMLVMMGDQWLTIPDDDGNLRLFEPDDWVRIEVGIGLEKPSLTVIPVSIDDAPLPREEQLPNRLKSLSKRNAAFLQTDERYFRGSVKQLIEDIEEQFPPETPSAAPETISEPVVAPGDNQSQLHGCWNQFRALPRVIQAIAGIIGFIIAVLGLVLTFIEVFATPEQVGDIQRQLGIITDTPQATIAPTVMPTSTPDLPAIDTELSNVIMSNYERIPLASIASEPRNLVLAPSPEGMALWGYSGAGGTVFAVAISTQTPIDLTPDDTNTLVLSPENTRVNGLHYDGTWLWIADGANQRVLALDPQTLNIVYEMPVNTLRGQPAHLMSINNRLWIAIPETGQVTALDIDHSANDADFACSLRYTDIGVAPSQIMVQGNTLWVAYGRADGAIAKVNGSTCRADETIELDVRIQNMVLLDDRLWIASGQGLIQLDTTTSELTETDVESVAQVFAVNDQLWLVDDDNNLLRIDSDTIDTTLSLSVLSTPTSIYSSGIQLWVATEDNTLTLFTLPTHYRPDWLDIAVVDNELWGLTANNEICPLDDAPCLTPTIADTATIMISTTQDDGFWIGTEARDIWFVDTSGEAEKRYAIPATIEGMIDMGDYLWVSDYFASLTIVDQQTNRQLEALQFNMSIPSAMAYDGTSVWLAYSNPARVIETDFDGDQVREIRSIDAPIDSVSTLNVNSDQMVIGGPGILSQIDLTSDDRHTIGSVRNPERVIAYNNRLMILSNGALFEVE